MIHYQLVCDARHEFDGWYSDSAGFERLAAARLIDCPFCGSTQVARALMAPAVKTRKAEPAVPAPPPPPSFGSGSGSEPSTAIAVAPPGGAVAVSGGAKLPDHMRAMLLRVREEIEKRCDYVGADFAAEARRIHKGDSARTGIYGETTPEEAEALAEEGIDIASIPWVPRADS